MSKLSYKEFLTYSIPVSIGQSLILMAVWYVLGASYTAMTQYIAYPFIAILILCLAIFFMYKKIGNYAEQQFE